MDGRIYKTLLKDNVTKEMEWIPGDILCIAATVGHWAGGEEMATHMETGEIRSLLYTVHKSHLQMDTIL